MIKEQNLWMTKLLCSLQLKYFSEFVLLRFSPLTEAWLASSQPWAAKGPSKEQKVDNKYMNKST